MTRLLIRCALCVLALAAAQGATAETSRFTMTPVEDGGLRLDTQTGAVSHCTAESGRWMCADVTDEGVARGGRIESLEQENAALKQENAGLKSAIEGLRAERGPAGCEGAEKAPPGAAPQTSKPAMPGDEEIDQMMAFLEKMARRLKAMVEDLKREQTPPPATDQL